MAKTKTSSAVKRRYNNKVYASMQVWIPKDLVARFREECVERGVSQASVIKEAIEMFLSEER